MTRIGESKRAHRRGRFSEKKRARKASKSTGAQARLGRSARLVTRRRAEPASAEPPRDLEHELEETFFSQPPLAPTGTPDVDEPSAAPPWLTPAQGARRRWFRRKVQHLMAGLTAFTGLAALVHVAHLG